MHKSSICVRNRKRFTVDWSATAVWCVSKEAGVQHVTQGHFSSSRDYLKLMDTQQDPRHSSSLAPPLSALPGGGSIKWRRIDVPCCLSVYPTQFLSLFINISINQSNHLSIYPSVLICVFSLFSPLNAEAKSCMHKSLFPSGSFLQSPSDPPQRLCVSEQLLQLQTADSFRRKTNVGDPLTDLLPAGRPAEPGSGKLTTASISNSVTVGRGYFSSD